MLKITVPEEELYNEATNEFYSLPSVHLELEHSLVSLSKWESIFHKPFLADSDKTPEEMEGYIESMILSPVFPSGVVRRLSSDNLRDIYQYIDSKATATTFGEMPDQRIRGRKETITSELIYYWLVAYNIPFEVENWHLNRLFALIRICNVKNSKPKKMSKAEIARRNRALNEQRRRELGTRG